MIAAAVAALTLITRTRDPLERLISTCEQSSRKNSSAHSSFGQVTARVLAADGRQPCAPLRHPRLGSITREIGDADEVRAFEKVQKSVKNGVAVMEAPALCRRISFQPCLVMGKLPMDVSPRVCCTATG